MHLEQNKKRKFCTEDKNYSHSGYINVEERTPSKARDYSDVFALAKLLKDLDEGEYGSATKEFETVRAQRMQVINLLSALQPSLASPCASRGLDSSQAGLCSFSSPSARMHHVNPDKNINGSMSQNAIDLDVDPFDDMSRDHNYKNVERKDNTSIIVIDSDEEDGDFQKGPTHSSTDGCVAPPAWLESQLHIYHREDMLLAQGGHSNKEAPHEPVCARLDCGIEGERQLSIQYEKVVLGNVTEKQSTQDFVNQNCGALRGITGGEGLHHEEKSCRVGRGKLEGKDHHEKSVEKKSDLSPSTIGFVAMQECSLQAHSSNMGIHNEDITGPSETEGLEDLWKDMSLAMEFSKDDTLSDGPVIAWKEEDCEHSYLLEDDLGLVCRICGVIQKSIDTIFDYQWTKGTRSAGTYVSGSRHSKEIDEAVVYSRSKDSEQDLIAADISVHPRHMKQMKPHQIEGFSFLVRNLVSEKPGGCILAHAPGSGKTFMLISFIQSFLAKYPSARPLVVLPKGILATWKKEFRRWQVEDIPLHDFYSVNATSRAQQLDVLRSWEQSRSILFLGYKQFANIISGRNDSKIESACEERLLTVPSLLILDEGHTPRNESTEVLNSLAKVQTPRKVVLSGTIFQNHVREVFTILNLVRPKFLKMESSRAVVKRVLSKVYISGSRRVNKGCFDSAFYDLVEETLQDDDNYKRKVTIIQDLREMTHDILHYYKGDFSDELPGLLDFTVLLNLTAKQTEIVKKLGGFARFKRSSVGNAVYIHPQLREISEHEAGGRDSDERIDSIVDSVDVADGVKTKFFLSVLAMAESRGEKLLVFSQYLLPLKFLERLLARRKGWRIGNEMLMITGDSNSEERECSMEQFNSSAVARVFFGSIKACGEGVSLVGASRVLILDVHLNPSVTRQAIGRAFRPGQLNKVYVYRLVAADSSEEEDHRMAFKKELISKMWFEWSEFSSSRDFELQAVDPKDSQDVFFQNPKLGEDVKVLYTR